MFIKIKTKIKQTAAYLTALTICALALSQIVIIAVYGALSLPVVQFIVNPYKDVLAAVLEEPGLVIREVRIEEPTNPDVWVAWRIAEAGLNPIEAFVVQANESGYKNNDNIIGYNNNGSVDLGRWQWNSQHVESGFITLACAGDYRCSTDKAIESRLKDGSWAVKWYGAKKAGIY